MTLSGLKILVVEDEPLLAMALEDTLIDFGCAVVGPAHSLSCGLQLVEHHAIDGAILDVNLAGEKVFPLADLLVQRCVPFVYVTGYGTAVLRERDDGCPVLQKPCDPQALMTIVRGWRRARVGTSSQSAS